jgi:integrase
MNGHVRSLRGYWRILLELEPDDGRRRQEMLPEKYTVKKTAEKAMHEALRDRERGTWVAPVDLTLGDYLETRWLPSLGAENLSPNTLHAYKLHVKRINAHIGSIPLQKLTRNDVSVMAGKLAAETSIRGSILSPASRRAVLVVLHHALGDAVAAGLLRTNPAHGVPRPTVRAPELHTWSRDELAKFLQATKDDRLSPLWRLLAMTGVRRGEALGLQWSDVDLASGRLAIQRQRVTTNYEVMERPTKTDRGRSVAIDAATVSALQRQSQQQLDDAAEWKAAWVGDGHVFTREDGEPWHPDRITDLFRQAVKAAGVPSIRLHDLRHGWATLALGAGIHPKVVQERLGHANIAMTMDRYSHVIPALQESAAELVAALVDGAQK